jgi:hypothetical protein
MARTQSIWRIRFCHARPLRQFVSTVPFELRARLAYDGKLLGAAGRSVVDSVLGFYRRTTNGVWRPTQDRAERVTFAHSDPQLAARLSF